MNRKTFLKKLALGVVVTAVTPKVIANLKPEPPITCNTGGLLQFIKESHEKHPPLLMPVDYFNDTLSPEMFIKEWQRTGLIIYRNQCSPNPK